MVKLNNQGYLEKRHPFESTYRSWWLVKDPALLNLGTVRLPSGMVGKRIRLKVEII